MIEKILRKPSQTFSYGEVAGVSAAEGKVKVDLGASGAVWIETDLILEKGDVVIVARHRDSSMFIVQHSGKVLPSERTLLLV